MATTTPDFDRNDIIRTIQLFHEKGDVVELRILNAGRYQTISGYFDNVNAFTDNVVGLCDEKFEGYYFTLNKINPDLFARLANKYERYAKETTADKDVIRREWLPIDLDAIRLAGISSTNEEHNAALDMTIEVKKYLIKEHGWSPNAFIRADSGNGGHLSVKIDLPNDNESTDLVKRCLLALDYKFSNEVVKVDTSTFNAARIWKLYGTVARKGSNVPNRPHRVARLLDVPEGVGYANVEVVTKEQLDALAATLPKVDHTKDKSSGKTQGNTTSNFDPAKYAEEHGATVLKVKPWTDLSGGKWDLAILKECPFDPTHNRGEVYIGLRSDGARSFSCKHDHCAGNDWQALKRLWGSPKHDQPTVKHGSSSTEGNTNTLTLEQLTKATGKMKQIDPDTGDVILDESNRPVLVTKRALSPSKAALAILSCKSLRINEMDKNDIPKIWKYDGSIWKADGEREIRSIVYPILGDWRMIKGSRRCYIISGQPPHMDYSIKTRIYSPPGTA